MRNSQSYKLQSPRLRPKRAAVALEAHARIEWMRTGSVSKTRKDSPSQTTQRKPTNPSSVAVIEVTAPLRSMSITILEHRKMSIGSQCRTDAWDIRRDKNDEGEDSGSDPKSWDAGTSIDTVASGLGNEVCADAQDDEGKGQGDAWRSPTVSSLRDALGCIR